MSHVWTLERLRALPAAQVRSLYTNARAKSGDGASKLVALIVESDLLVDEKGGLPFDHPVMLEIEEICRAPEAVQEAISAVERGLPALAGMEHRLVSALGDQYGSHYTTHHAGRCIAEEMLAKGWIKAPQRAMPVGSVAKTATTFVKR